ncbi:hypothetical protein KJ865_03835 [Myxococcota bacterium]|nr:hypothetical protein [Myxococcota bacterium]
MQRKTHHLLLGFILLGCLSCEETKVTGAMDIHPDPTIPHQYYETDSNCWYVERPMEPQTVVDGTRLYLVESYRGLFVYDLSTPGATTLLGVHALTGYLGKLAVHNGVVLVAQEEHSMAEWTDGLEWAEASWRARALVLDARDPGAITELASSDLAGHVMKTGFVGEVAAVMTWLGDDYDPVWISEIASFAPAAGGAYTHVETVTQEGLFETPEGSEPDCQSFPRVTLAGGHLVAHHPNGMFDARVDSATGAVTPFQEVVLPDPEYTFYGSAVQGDILAVWARFGTVVTVLRFHVIENTPIEQIGTSLQVNNIEGPVLQMVTLHDLVLLRTETELRRLDFSVPIAPIVLTNVVTDGEAIWLAPVEDRLMVVSSTLATVFDATAIRSEAFEPRLELEFLPGYILTPEAPSVAGRRVLLSGRVTDTSGADMGSRTVVLTADATALAVTAVLQETGSLTATADRVVVRWKNNISILPLDDSVQDPPVEQVIPYRSVLAVSPPIGGYQALLSNVGGTGCTLETVPEGQFDSPATAAVSLSDDYSGMASLKCLGNQCWAQCNSLHRVDLSDPLHPLVVNSPLSTYIREWSMEPLEGYVVFSHLADGMNNQVLIFANDANSNDGIPLLDALPFGAGVISVTARSDRLFVEWRESLGENDTYINGDSYHGHLAVVDIADPMNPRQLDDIVLPGRVVHVDASGEHVTVFGYRAQPMSGEECLSTGGVMDEQQETACLIPHASRMAITREDQSVTVGPMEGYVAALTVSGNVLMALVLDNLVSGWTLRLWDLSTGEEGTPTTLPAPGRTYYSDSSRETFQFFGASGGRTLFTYGPGAAVFAVDASDIHAPVVSGPTFMPDDWTTPTTTDSTAYFPLGLAGVAAFPR